MFLNPEKRVELPFQGYYESEIGPVANRLRSRSYYDHVAEQPSRIYDSNSHLVAMELKHPDADPDSTVALLYPTAEGNSKRMRAQMGILQRSLKEPRNIVGFPTNALGDELGISHNFDLNEDENKSVASGDLQPFSNRIWRFLHNKNINFIDVVGIELGASIGATMPIAANGPNGHGAEQGYVRSMTLIEPPNVIDRNHKDLWNVMNNHADQKAMQKMLDILDIPALNDEYPEFVMGALKRRVARNNAFESNSKTYREDATTRAIIKGLCHNRFGADLAYRTSERAVILHGEKSELCPTLKGAGKSEITTRVRACGWGSEMIYNPFVIAQAAKYAIETLVSPGIDLSPISKDSRND